jgi:hypothetical protein
VGGVNSIGSGPFSEEIEVEIRIASTSIAPSSTYSEFVTEITQTSEFSSVINPAAIETVVTSLHISMPVFNSSSSTAVITNPSITPGNRIVVYASVAGAITLLLIIMILAIIAVVVVIILRRNKVKHKTGILLDEQQSPNFTKRDVYFPVIESSFSEFNNTKSSNVNVYVKFVNFNSRRNS